MREPRLAILDSNRTKLPCGDQKIEKKPRKCEAQTMDKKLSSPEGKNSHPRKRRHNGKPDSVIWVRLPLVNKRSPAMRGAAIMRFGDAA